MGSGHKTSPGDKDGHRSPTPNNSPFRRFEDFAKRLVSVPKKEIEKQAKRQRKARS